jgi:hypothetical protein
VAVGGLSTQCAVQSLIAVVFYVPWRRWRAARWLWLSGWRRICCAGTPLRSQAARPTLNDFFLPGSQPGQSGQLETPQKCDNCHGGYNLAVEPAFNWRGSMMSQAARDPFFYAAMTVANQDATDSGDLCIRCHSPAGWLEGRSVPTDGSALNNNDREGVQCDFCHKLLKPSPLGVNPYPSDPIYITRTYPRDQTYLGTLSQIPPTESGGMYVADSDNAKRGPFATGAPHNFTTALPPGIHLRDLSRCQQLQPSPSSPTAPDADTPWTSRLRHRLRPLQDVSPSSADPTASG